MAGGGQRDLAGQVGRMLIDADGYTCAGGVMAQLRELGASIPRYAASAQLM